MNLYLIRHAESLGNVDRSVYFQMPDWKIPITEKGKEQAKSAANKLKKMFGFYNYVPIITSPYVRAKQTTDIIKSVFEYSTIFESPLVRERDWGLLREEVEATSTREERNHLFDFYRRPERGESFADVYQRATVFINCELPKYKSNGNLVIVSHGEFIKVMKMVLNGDTVEEFENSPKIKNCEIITKHIDL